MRFLSIILVVLAYFSSILNQIEGSKLESFKEFSRVFKAGLKDENNKFSAKNLVDEIILDAIPFLSGQKPSNLEGKNEQYEDYLTHDHTNDEIGLSSVKEICERSGYQVENYKVVADDAYITYLFRIINPLADRKKLKQPPVMLMHGALVDPTCYIWASSIQHHPEKYPRTAQDGPMTSWNRSLAFTLANNGYDVWLVGTRGSGKKNQGREHTHAIRNFFRNFDNKNETLGKKLVELKGALKYWYYSFDELIELELPSQLDRVLEVTGAKKVSLMAYSYATTVTLSLLGTRPDIAMHKIHNYICMAPLINFQSANLGIQQSCKIIPFIPVELGTLMVTKILDSTIVHKLQRELFRPMGLRYSLAKMLFNLIDGPSGKYRTALEPALLGHIDQPVSFKQYVHTCQMVNAKQYQKYDYGLVSNKFIYGSFKPPVYNISDIHVKNWMLISASNDNYAGKLSIEQILKQVNPKPLEHVNVTGYNHLDLIAGVDNDIMVNLPILDFLDRFALPSGIYQ